MRVMLSILRLKIVKPNDFNIAFIQTEKAKIEKSRTFFIDQARLGLSVHNQP